MIEEQYVDRIMYEIDGSTIRRKELKDDLVDHFCCLVEMDMKKGVGFDEAYQRAYKQTCPNGFDEIQRETVVLLNYKLLMLMKRATFISGFLFSAMFTAGAIMKVLHLPGSALLLMLGMLGLAGFFLPLLVINHFKRNLKTLLSEKLQWFFGCISLVAMGVGSVFKAMHCPGAAMLLGLGGIIFISAFLPILFYKLYKRSLQEM